MATFTHSIFRKIYTGKGYQVAGKEIDLQSEKQNKYLTFPVLLKYE